jgi:hypothetical protein
VFSRVFVFCEGNSVSEGKDGGGTVCFLNS